MAYYPIEELKKGNNSFLNHLTQYDKNYLIQSIRKSSDRMEIIDKNIDTLINQYPSFVFEIIYDLDEYKDKVFYLIKEYDWLSFDIEKIKNILFNTNYGIQYVYDNLDSIISINPEEIIKLIIDSIYNKTDNRDKWIERLSKHSNLNYRFLFMLDIIENYPNEIINIYDDISKYFINYNYDKYEQLTFFPDKMTSSQVSKIVYMLFKSNKNRQLYLKLKKYLLDNYDKNDLAEYLLSSHISEVNHNKRIKMLGKCEKEFNKDADNLFITSHRFQYYIYINYRAAVSKYLFNTIEKLNKIFNTKDYRNPIERIHSYGLTDKLNEYVEKYLDLSVNKDYSYLASGISSDCFRIGDYVIKLVNFKWSYEDVICPNLYLIIKNLEEIFIRDERNFVLSGIEVQKYLTRSAEYLDSSYFQQYRLELGELGYYLDDTLMQGQCGDNCRILDTYLDADCDDPESLPDHFKKTPLVLIDRDLVFNKNESRKKRMYSKY